MTKRKDHIHKFRRKTYKSTGTSVFYCIDNCDYKIGVEFSLGKMNRCNVCNEPFQMNEYSIRAAKPKCFNCVKRRTINKELQIANPLDRSDSIRQDNQTVAIANDRTNELKEKLANLTIKTFNPDDEEDSL